MFVGFNPPPPPPPLPPPRWWAIVLSIDNVSLVLTTLVIIFCVWYSIATVLDLPCPATEATSSKAESEFTSVLAWINDYTHYNIQGEVIYPFPNFNSAIVEVWKSTNNFIPQFSRRVITYPCWDQCKSMPVTGALDFQNFRANCEASPYIAFRHM